MHGFRYQEKNNLTRNKGEKLQTFKLKIVSDLMANTMITSAVDWNLHLQGPY